MKANSPESKKFDAAMRKLLSVSREELHRRQGEWKRQKARKKRTKA